MLRLARQPFFWIIALVVVVFALAPRIGNNVELRESLILAALYITLASNLNLMLGYAGYVNFGSIVFFGLGGYICIWLINAQGWPLGLSLIAAGICVSLLALLFGLGILRLRGAFFALATIGVNEAIQGFVENFGPWGGSSGIYLSPVIFKPLGGPAQALWVIYALMVAIMGLSLYLSYFIKRSKFGLGLLAIGQNEDAAAILGVPTPLYKALVYSISAFLPAVAGGLYFFKSAFIQPSDAFDWARNGHRGSGWRLPLRRATRLPAHVGDILPLSIGDRRRSSPPDCLVLPERPHGLDLQTISTHAKGAGMTSLLEVDTVSKRFGGLKAVQNLSFTVQEGEIIGLIGPNGAGKTKLFNLINGVYAPDTGRVVFCGRDITGQKPYHVARRGLARTHQIVQPLTNMTVLDNCTVGACFGREDLPLVRAREAAREAVTIADLADRQSLLAMHLTIAGKKRLELARALAARPLLLLLDEALAGLNPTEVAHMISVIREVRKRGVAILMIEHLMQAIMNLSDRIVVLNFGKKLAEGLPGEVAQNPQVIEAYLGNPELAAELRRSI
jgi:ABC-type branched-subunit amino acid transport system ATPase component/ABC-type branched-subunit amino acid transport system permease subunit